MKITDLLIENKTQVDEAPMGFLKTMGNKVASTFGSGKAQGRLDTGKLANDLRKEFDVYLGQTGQEPTGEMVLGFLKSKGYPTSSASKILGNTPTASPADAAQAKPGADADGKIEPTMDKEPAANAPAAPKPGFNNQLAGGKQNITVKPAAQATPKPAEEPAAQATPDAGAGVMGNMVKQQMGDNPVTMKPAPQKAPPAPAAAPAAKQPAVPARPQGGGKVAGALSTSPNAVAKRQARAVKKRTTHPADDNPNIQLGTESIQRMSTFEQHLNYFRMLAEGLSGKQLDAVFLAAAQEKARTPAAAGQSSPTAGGNAQGGAAPAAGNGQAAQGGNAPGAPLTAPAGKPGQPKGDSPMDVLIGARDGFKGVDYTKGGDPRNKRLMDPTGRIPEKIVQKINKMSPEDRKKLRAELDKA